MEWKRAAEDDYYLALADGVWLNVYLPRLNAKWKWGVYGMGQNIGGRVETEAEAKTAAILRARKIITAKQAELDSALAILNAAATLEPTP